MSKKRTFPTLIAAIVGLMFANFSNAELAIAEPGKFGYKKCLDVQLTRDKIAQIRADLSNAPSSTAVAKSAISVPVNFFIIQDSGVSNPATVDQINEQMSVLNSAYAKANVSFTLQGISTVVNDSWAIRLGADSAEADDMKATLHQGDSQTLNIYLTDLGDDLLGYATFPWDYEESPQLDGVVILSSTLPGGDASPYDGGKTIVHEVGHWLGLLHTFQPPPSSNNGCKGSGDWVSDTPFEKIAHYACRRSDSCRQSGTDPIRNYMNYTPDACQTKFTAGQRDLIQEMWFLYRAL